jgi:hypothetical protein
MSLWGGAVKDWQGDWGQVLSNKADKAKNLWSVII